MILFSRWLTLPLDIRHKIANDFGIIKRGSTHVVDNKIQSDGFLVEEIESALTKEAMQLHLGMMHENDMVVLWDTMVARMKGEEITVVKPAISILPPEEAKQFKREYNQRKKDGKVRAKN